MRFVYHTATKILRASSAVFLLCVAANVRSAVLSADDAFYAEFQPMPAVAELTALGRTLFFDVSLSASGSVACASCHDPRHAYALPHSKRITLDRTVPSLRYLNTVPPFTEHFHDTEGDESLDQGPVGGHTWDGRAQSTHEQARLPLFAPNEMANRDEEQVIARVSGGNQAGHFRRVFGADIFAQPRRAFKALLLALEVFQQSPTDFYPFRSKYDEFLRGKVQLTQAETRGLELFNDAAKGNCASCHPSSVNRGAFPLFTDFGYAALGVPRNRTLAANTDAAYFDLGLCGPKRTDLAGRSEYCGLFRVPTLRNVALREAFFHNGSVRTLEDAIRFYAERDSHPEKWYPRSRDQRIREFDDLPLKYHDNINRDPPFGNSASDGPRLSDREIADIAAFLRTLTDADLIP